MPNEDHQQNINLALIQKDISYIKESLDGNTEEHKDIKTRISSLKENVITKDEVRQMIQSGNGRVATLNEDVKGIYNELYKQKLAIKELEPTKIFVDGVQGKIFWGFFALLSLLGAIIYAALNFLNKK